MVCSELDGILIIYGCYCSEKDVSQKACFVKAKAKAKALTRDLQYKSKTNK